VKPVTALSGLEPSISAQTRNYYTQAIQTAVKQNQIEQAMQLVDEAQRLGFSDAKTIFVTAVKQK
jgi:maltose operon protein